jgi:hypothetical protein
MRRDDDNSPFVRPWTLAAAGFVIMTAAYTLVFTLTGDDPFGRNLIDALINVTPLTACSIGAFALNRALLLRLPTLAQWPLHLLAALVFATTWYFLVTVLLGWRDGDFTSRFSVRPFSSIAYIWQVFQGATLYALVVATALIVELRERLASSAKTDADEPGSSAAERLLIRGEEDWTSVAVDDIVSVTRAGDYAQIVAGGQRHLVRRSLAELLDQLPPERFLRVHRSHLINLDAFESAESIGGGRLRIHLRGGEQVETSRSGAQAFRKRAG